jgi:hypothetical protein
MRALTLASLLALAACSIESNLGNTGPSNANPAPLFGATRWAWTLGGPSFHDEAEGIAVDPHTGDVYVAGTAAPGADFGSGPVGVATEWGDSVGFLTRRAAADGSEVWTVPIAGYGTGVFQLALDPDGNAIVTGEVGEDVDLGGVTLSAEHGVTSNAFIAEYDPSGVLRWARGLGAGATIWVTAAAEGSVYAAMSIHTPVDLGGTTYTPVGYGGDGVLMALDRDGNVMWFRIFTGDAGQALASPLISPDGDVWVGGATSTPAELDGHAIDAPRYHTSVLARFHPDGTYVSSFVRYPEAEYGDIAWTFAVTPDGDVAMGGADESGHLSTTLFDAEGNEQWNTEVAPGGGGDTYAMTVTGDGMILDGGTVGSLEPVDFGTGPLHGLFVQAFDEDGVAVDGISFNGDDESDGVTTAGLDAIAVGADGTVALVGGYTGSLDIGTGPLPVAGYPDPDLVIAAFDPPAAP